MDKACPTSTKTWGTGFADSVAGALNQSGSVATVSIGRFTDDFTVSGTTFTSIQAKGATLSLSGGIYTYTSSDGSVAHFDSSKTLTTPYFGSLGMITDVTSASGVRRAYGYDYANGCLHMTGSTCTVHQSYYRLSSITDSFGFQIDFTYDLGTYDEANSPDPVGDFRLWKTRNWAGMVNLEKSGSPILPLQGVAGTNSFVVTDPMSRSTTYRMSGGFVVGVTYPGSGSENVTVTYSGGRVANITSAGGTWSYAASDNTTLDTRTVVVTDPASHGTTYMFKLSTALLTSVTNALGKTVAMQYDTNGRLTRTTAPEGNYTQLTYDARGNVTETRAVAKSASGLSDIVASASYPSSCTNPVTCNAPISTTDARGKTTDYTYDATSGGVLTVTAPAPTTGATRPQVRTSYTGYSDYFSNTIYLPTATSACRTGASCAGTADEVVTGTSYGSVSANNLLPVSRSTGAGDGSVTTSASVTYDSVGNVASSTDPLAAVTTYYYDADRERTLAVSPDPDGSGPRKNRAVKANYNPDGTVASAEAGTANADGTGFASLQQVATSYDAALRKTRQVLTAGGTTYGVTEYSYDSVGRSDCVAVRLNPAQWGTPTAACTAQVPGSDGPDRIARTTYDIVGRVTKVQSAFGIAGVQADEASATYTDNGQVATATDAENNTTSYAYDGDDRLSTTTYPSTTKGAGTSNTGDYEQLTYDAGSNVTSRRLRDGSSIGYTYDALNRATAKDLPGSELDVAYTYDLLGKPLTAVTGAQTVTLDYDALGRAKSQATGTGTVGYQYDAAGRRTRMTWPDAFYVSYDYDPTGNLKTIKESGSTTLAAFDYDDLGRRTQLTRGNGVATTYGYDSVSRLTSLVSDPAGTSYDLTLGFGYNNAGQIKSTTRSNDAYSWTGAANVTRGYTANGLNQFTASGTVSLGYDARGNLTSSGSDSYTYSSENLLLTGRRGQA